MTQHTFLVEIGTEELPPKSLRTLAESFAENMKKELSGAGLLYEKVEWYASPRRLAVKVKALNSKQSDRKVEKRGPAVSQAFDAEGKPSQATIGWAKGCGIAIEQAEKLVTDKGEWLIYRSLLPGKTTQSLLLSLVEHALTQLPIAKSMRWGDKEVTFIRPVHTVTLLYGDELIPGTLFGVTIDRQIQGHRFMGEQKITLEQAEQYPEILFVRGKVVADYQQRKSIIKQQAEALATRIGGQVDLDDDLLEEVTSLVEWPVVLSAKFEEKFLVVPAEALVHTMKGDQKYFPIYAKDGSLLPHFIFVANIESKELQVIIAGNEKVVRPRLADAEFFFKTDKMQRLDSRLPLLSNVLFQQQLGSLKDKTDRVEVLSGWIAQQIGADVNKATRAGLLSKCDLMTNMVFEFTDTQGVMGMYYAREDGEDEEVALALNEQYLPRFSGDKLPGSLVSCSVAIADKTDTIVGIFGINQQPKGDKDPFALRRATLGILRILIEKSLSLDLKELIQESVRLYDNKLSNTQVIDDIMYFIFGRVKSLYQEKGYPVDVIQAVLARLPTNPADIDARLKAVSYFATLKEAASLIEANKRVSNILSKNPMPLADKVTPSMLKEEAEIVLASVVGKMNEILPPLFAKGHYKEALSELVVLHKDLDNFFIQVMVMVDDENLRVNRLTLLNQVRTLFLQIADISLLQR